MPKFDHIQNALNSAVEISNKLQWEYDNKKRALEDARESAKDDPDFWNSVIDGYVSDIAAYDAVFQALENFVKKAV